MPANGKKDSSTGQAKYDFIEEQIVPKRKNKAKKLLFSIGTTVCLAIIFGIVSRAVFCISGTCIDKVFGEDKDKKIISFTTPSPVPESTPEVQATKEPEETKDNVQIIENVVDADLKDYSKMYALLSEVAKDFNKSVVTVSSVINGVDWFDNPSERLDASYGVIIANNGEDLLVLTSKNKIEDANSMRVTFSDHVTREADLYGYDSEAGIAILSVPIEKINEKTMDTIQVAVLGDSYYLPLGTPVLALGSPNGYVYSMDLGIITNSMVETYVTDSKLELFNTDMTNNANGEGVIVGLNGQVLGIITHDFNSGLNENVSTVLGITRLKAVIERLVNKTEQVYFGIVGNDIPKEYADELNIDSGVYVTEVLADSPAFKAGIKNGDIILGIEENNIPSMSTFNSVISNYTPKRDVDVKLLRTSKNDNNKITVQVTLAEKN